MNNHGEAFVRSSTVGNRTRLILWVLATALFNSIFDASAAELCAPAIALVVSVQGIVEVRRFKEKNWQPALLNDILSVSAEVVKLGRASLVFRQRVERGVELLVEADVTLALVERSRMKPARIPEELEQALMK